MGKVKTKLDTMLQVAGTFGFRHGMLRLHYELQRGTGLMLWRMRSVQGWDSWDLDRISPGVRAEEILQQRRDGRRRFFFSDARSLGSTIRKIISADAEAELLVEANNILKGNLPYFGALSLGCAFPPRWFQNPVTGQKVSPRQPWTEMRFASPAYGDLKFILEPSRFLFIYPLARAYALTGDDRFAEAFWNSIEDWAYHSPPMSGPLWICGQECSLRILAWTFALHAFIHSTSSTSERTAKLVSMIAAHAWRTAQTIGYARSQRSNHLISEAVGLWTAGTLFPELREADVWQNLGAQLLHEAVLDQIGPEGVSQQFSFNYQRMILHLLLWVLRLAEICDVTLPMDIRERAQVAADFIYPWVDPASGQVSNYGSDDGSLIFPLASSSYRDFRPLLRLSRAVLRRPDSASLLAHSAGSEDSELFPWDELSLWFGLKPEAEQDKPKQKQTGQKQPSTRPAPANSGFFRLGDETSWALIRAAHYTRRPFQADQLHVDIWHNGVNLARDPGTYLYNGPAPWNNGFAGTAVHNTVTIDNHDQMRRAGRFFWLDWAQATGRIYSADEGRADCFEGEHNGYARLGVTHRRMVRWLPECGWVISDDLTGSGGHHSRLHWLLPDLRLEVEESPLQLMLQSQGSQIRWNIFCSPPGNLAIVRAGKTIYSTAELSDDETQLLGWESPTYGKLQPAISLVYEADARLPIRFVTLVLTNERCRLKTIGTDIVVFRNAYDSLSRTEEIYRVSLSHRVMQQIDQNSSVLTP